MIPMMAPALDPARLLEADRIFAALGDGTRRAIVRMVAEGPRTVSALAQALDVSLTAVTQHLRVLQGCGLLHTRKEGRVRMCELDGQCRTAEHLPYK